MSDADAALRADIRRLGMLLGQTLARQEGRPCSTSSRRSAALVRTDAGGRRRPAGRRWTSTTGTKLARAFSTYFHLANITEQVHRARDLRRRRGREGGWLDQAAQADRRAGRAGGRDRGGRRGGWRSARSSPPTRPRPPAARSCPSCARSPTSWTPRRPTAAPLRRDRPGARRPAAGRADRPAVADRRAAAGPAGPDRRGAQRRLLPARPVRRRGPAGARRPRRDAARARRADLPPTARPLTLRLLDRRRPRRQPVRHPGGHPRRAADPARARHPGRRGGAGRA